MSRRLRSESGQLFVPMVGVLLVLGFFSAGYLRWCRSLYWRTRIETAADAAALSSARAEAQNLNRISTANLMINDYVQKVRVPFTNWEGGVVAYSKYAEYIRKTQDLKAKVDRYAAYPVRIGQLVARANGAEGISVFTPIKSLLVGVSLPVLVYQYPYLYFPAYVNNAYFARGWSPGYRKAQPPHRTTWLVHGHGFKAYSTARVWLDIPTSASSLVHNGGFPRVNEGFFGSILVQNLFPQFAGRLAPRISITSALLRGLLGGNP